MADATYEEGEILTVLSQILKPDTPEAEVWVFTDGAAHAWEAPLSKTSKELERTIHVVDVKPWPIDFKRNHQSCRTKCKRPGCGAGHGTHNDLS